MPESFEEFLSRREAVSHAYIRGDAAPLSELLTAEDPATFLPPSGAVVAGAATVRDAQVGGASSFGSDGVGTFEIVASGADHHLGYLTARQVATVRMDGGDLVDMTLRITEVFRLEDSEWKLVHRHADVVAHED